MIVRPEPLPVPEPVAREPVKPKEGQRDFAEVLHTRERANDNASARQETAAPTLLTPSDSDSPVWLTRTEHSRAGTWVSGLLVPWQLQSQFSLSQLASEARAAIIASAEAPSIIFASSQASAATGSAMLVAPVPGRVLSQPNDASAISRGTEAPAARNASAEAIEVSKARDVVAGLPNPWSDRLVRWIDRDQHGVTAWVRDFQLTEEEAARLIQEIVAFAKSNSMILERIVVNGKERWRSEPSHPEGSY